MADLPAVVSYGTVTGTFVRAVIDSDDAGDLPDSIPVAGTVTFTCSAKKIVAGGKIIIPSPITVTLDGAGSFTTKVVATDDPDTNPNGFTYLVETSFGLDPFSIAVPSGTTVDLSAAAPVGSSGGTLIVKGDKGDPGDTLTVFTIPARELEYASASHSGGAAIIAPTFGVVASRESAWTVPKGNTTSSPAVAGQSTQLSTTQWFPAGWNTMNVFPILANPTASSGNVSWSVETLNAGGGESFNQSPTGSGNVIAVPTTQYVQKDDVKMNATPVTVVPPKKTTVRVSRSGASGSDSLAGSVLLLGLRFEKVT